MTNHQTRESGLEVPRNVELMCENDFPTIDLDSSKQSSDDIAIQTIGNELLPLLRSKHSDA